MTRAIIKMDAERARILIEPLQNNTAIGISGEWPARLVEAFEYVIENAARLEQLERENAHLRGACICGSMDRVDSYMQECRKSERLERENAELKMLEPENTELKRLLYGGPQGDGQEAIDPAALGPNPTVEDAFYEWELDSGEASGIAPTEEEARREANHYSMMYEQNYELYRVVRIRGDGSVGPEKEGE